MPRMSDEKYTFIQDAKEKKSTARSARQTRTHCGKSGAVKFPSDYMTEKERQAMNGKCETYRMNSPMTWTEFKAMPDDLKIDYIKALREKYNVPDSYIAEMMGVKKNTLCGLFSKLKLNKGTGHGSRIWNKEGFDIWRGKVVETDAVLTREDIEKITAKDDTPELTNGGNQGSVPNSGTLTFEGNADSILRSINDILKNRYVRLNIQWTVTDNPNVSPITMDTSVLAKAAATIDYAVINAQRKERLGTKG